MQGQVVRDYIARGHRTETRTEFKDRGLQGDRSPSPRSPRADPALPSASMREWGGRGGCAAPQEEEEAPPLTGALRALCPGAPRSGRRGPQRLRSRV